MLINTSERVDIPHEPGQWMRFRQLTWGQRLKAAEAAQVRAMDTQRRELEVARLVYGDSMNEKIQEARDARAERVTNEEPDVLTQYDAATVVDCGIAEWSYDGKPDRASEKIDAFTTEWAAREILARNMRPPQSAPDTGTS
jgi:hypothetical protein